MKKVRFSKLVYGYLDVPGDSVEEVLNNANSFGQLHSPVDLAKIEWDATPDDIRVVGLDIDLVLVPAAIEAIKAGDKIKAIREIRLSTGCGLREAKDAADSYIIRERKNDKALAKLFTEEAYRR